MACLSDIDLATLHRLRLNERVHYKLSWWNRRANSNYLNFNENINKTKAKKKLEQNVCTKNNVDDCKCVSDNEITINCNCNSTTADCNLTNKVNKNIIKCAKSNENNANPNFCDKFNGKISDNNDSSKEIHKRNEYINCDQVLSLKEKTILLKNQSINMGSISSAAYDFNANISPFHETIDGLNKNNRKFCNYIDANHSNVIDEDHLLILHRRRSGTWP